MTRQFFDQVDDELRGLLPVDLRRFTSQRYGRLIKLWYSVPEFHYEAQLLPPRWSPTKRAAVEIGLHLESRSREQNEEALEELNRKRGMWAKRLKAAEAGPAIGPNRKVWFRVSEVMPAEPLEDPDFAGEVAERLAGYVRHLQPLLDPGSTRQGRPDKTVAR